MAMPATAADYHTALAACAGTPDPDACTARVEGEAMELAGIIADLEHYTEAWAEAASEAELAAAVPREAAELAHGQAIAKAWGLPGLPPAVSTAPLEALVAKERACRASAKCTAARADAKLELTFFTSVVNPMCTAEQDKEGAAADMRREHANPSGLYDKRRVYADGATIQSADEMLAGYTPAYVARRHHPWRGWRAECKPNPAYYDR